MNIPGLSISRALRSEWFALTLTFIAFAAIAIYFPLSGDDWGKATPLGRLADVWPRTFLPNGRYLGNLIVIGLVRAGLVGRLLIAACLTVTVKLMVDLAQMRTPFGYLLATTIMLAMPMRIWKQVIVWRSGFANYAISALLLLALALLARRYLRERPSGANAWPLYLGIGLLTFATSLFIEHVTVFLLGATALYALAQARTYRAIGWTGAAALIGSALGSAAMLLHPSYRQALEPGSYQELAHGSPLDIVSGFLYRCVFVYSTDVIGRVDVIGLAVIAGLVVVAMACTWGRPRAVSDMRFVALLWVGAAGVAAPLAVANPVGPRCFYASYVLLAIALLVWLRMGLSALGKRARAALAVAIILVALVMAGRYVGIYRALWSAEQARIQSVREQVAEGSRRVVIHPLPNGRFLQTPDPKFGRLLERYAVIHGVPAGSELVFVP